MGLESAPLPGQPFFNDAVAGTVVAIKATAGQLYSLRLVNTVAAVSYLQIFFRPAASVTLGTTAPDFVIRLNTSESLEPMGMPPGFGLLSGGLNGTGLSVAGTTTPTGNTGAAISVSAAFG